MKSTSWWTARRPSSPFSPGSREPKRKVLVQFFILRDDGIGTLLADALIERAKAGVGVHVLYDDVGSKSLSHRYVARLREAGVRVAGFNERHKWLRVTGPMRLNYRNHRKIVVVDAKEAWVGGHNVGDEYLGLSKEFGHWRDTHVRINGPAAVACALSFSEDWHWATGTPLQPLISRARSKSPETNPFWSCRQGPPTPSRTAPSPSPR